MAVQDIMQYTAADEELALQANFALVKAWKGDTLGKQSFKSR